MNKCLASYFRNIDNLLNHFRFTEVGCLFASPVVGNTLEKVGRKNMVLIGFLLLV